jgi:hypothetical protein
MAALKIFISHSSRPRAGEKGDPAAQQNWQLLQDTCKEIKAVYGDRIDILVDYQGLHAGNDWELRLNQWLAECHAAIILFSPRAIQASDWVRKEATILGWRAALDPGFKLFPVLLPPMTAALLDADPYFCSLNLTRTQCVQDATTAPEIVERIRPLLGDPATLPGNHQTAFQRKQSQVEELIARHVDRNTLADLCEKLGLGKLPLQAHADPHQGYAWSLATHLFGDGKGALQRAQNMLDHLLPTFPGESARALLKCLNALWVDAAAAGRLCEARSNGQCLGLKGNLIDHSDPERLDRPFFTLNRYLKRAWPETACVRLVSIAKVMSAIEIKNELCKIYQRGGRALTDDELGRRLLADTWQVVVFVTAKHWPDGAIDPRLVDELKNLKAEYHPLIFVFGIDGSMRKDLPEGVQAILPELDLSQEDWQYQTEADAWDLINN